MWTKKHTRAGINSPRGCVCMCVALCVALELSHIVVACAVCVFVWACAPLEVLHVEERVHARVYVCM